MYATKKRKRNMKQIKNPASGTDPPKSNPSKRHRERLNSELDHLASLLPYEQGIISKLDKLSVLRLAVNFLRTKSYFQVAFYDKLLNNNYHKVSNPPHTVLRHGYRPSINQEAITMYSNGKGKNEVTTTTPDMTSVAGADDILQALNGFVLVVTCEGEVFYASDTVEQYLGFHQSDIIHQSVMELIHSEDREQFKIQLLCRPSFDLSEVTSDHVTDAFLAFNQQHRRFNVRFRCLLDNTSGFITLEITGRLRVLYGQNLKTNASKTLALFALCSPLGVLPSSENQGHEMTFKSKHKMDMSPISMDPRGKMMFGYTDRDLMEKKGYDLIHYDDLSYYAAAHQELIKTGSSGLIAYRLFSKEFRWIWLQTSSKVMYKNSKPDYISCVHRKLTDDEGSDLLSKRGSEFKLPYALTCDPGYEAKTLPTSSTPPLSSTHPSLLTPHRDSSCLEGVEPDGGKHEGLISTTNSTSSPGISQRLRGDSETTKRKLDSNTNVSSCSSSGSCNSSCNDNGAVFNNRDNNEVVSEAHSMNASTKIGQVRSKSMKSQKKSRGQLKDYLQACRKRKAPYRDIPLYHHSYYRLNDELNIRSPSKLTNAGSYDQRDTRRREVIDKIIQSGGASGSDRGTILDSGFYGIPYNPALGYIARSEMEPGFIDAYNFGRYFGQTDDSYHCNTPHYYNYCNHYSSNCNNNLIFGNTRDSQNVPLQSHGEINYYANDCPEYLTTPLLSSIDNTRHLQFHLLDKSNDSNCHLQTRQCQLSNSALSTSALIPDHCALLPNLSPQNLNHLRHSNFVDCRTSPLVKTPNFVSNGEGLPHCQYDLRAVGSISDYYNSGYHRNHNFGRDLSQSPYADWHKNVSRSSPFPLLNLADDDGYSPYPFPPLLHPQHAAQPLLPASSSLSPSLKSSINETCRPDKEFPSRFSKNSVLSESLGEQSLILNRSALLLNGGSYLNLDGNNHNTTINNNNYINTISTTTDSNRNGKGMDDSNSPYNNDDGFFALNYTSFLNSPGLNCENLVRNENHSCSLNAVSTAAADDHNNYCYHVAQRRLNQRVMHKDEDGVNLRPPHYSSLYHSDRPEEIVSKECFEKLEMHICNETDDNKGTMESSSDRLVSEEHRNDIQNGSGCCHGNSGERAITPKQIPDVAKSCEINTTPYNIIEVEKRPSNNTKDDSVNIPVTIDNYNDDKKLKANINNSNNSGITCNQRSVIRLNNRHPQHHNHQQQQQQQQQQAISVIQTLPISIL